MEQLISDIEAYASQVDRKPQSVLRSAINASWGTWDAWVAGKSSPTLIVVDRIRVFMAENKPDDACDQREVA
jgi:hypothetical protein